MKAGPDYAEAARAILREVALFGAAAYPIRRFKSGRWTVDDWHGLTVTPTCYPTKREAIRQTERFLEAIQSNLAGEP